MRYLPLFFFMLLAISAKGSHIIGGDIYYDDLGGGNYRFFITIYRDCNSSGAEYDNPLKLSVYKVNQDLYQNWNSKHFYLNQHDHLEQKYLLME